MSVNPLAGPITTPQPPDIRWHPSARDADEMLRQHVAEVLGVPPEEVSTGRHCGRCGSAAHGQPWAKSARNGSCQVSLSRSGEHLVTAVARDGWVGIDVESVEALRARQPAEAENLTEGWTQTEAILKMLGVGLPGLAVLGPLNELVAGYDVRKVPAPKGYCAAVAVSRTNPAQRSEHG